MQRAPILSSPAWSPPPKVARDEDGAQKASWGGSHQEVRGHRTVFPISTVLGEKHGNGLHNSGPPRASCTQVSGPPKITPTGLAFKPILVKMDDWGRVESKYLAFIYAKTLGSFMLLLLGFFLELQLLLPQLPPLSDSKPGKQPPSPASTVCPRALPISPLLSHKHGE